MSESTPRLSGPLWARATRLFYTESLDVRSKKDFVEALQDFSDLSPAEQAFHQTHLLFRQLQALEDVYLVLSRLEKKLNGEALAELVPIRKSLKILVAGQEELLDLMESAQEAEGEEVEAASATQESVPVADLPDEIVDVLPEGPVEGEIIPAPEKPRASSKKRTSKT